MSTGDTDAVDVPEAYPAEDWTPTQMDNWESHMAEEYDRLETDFGREMYRRIWRPKKRGDGVMTREHAILGTPEDYVVEHVDDVFEPWGDMTGIMMRKVGIRGEEADRLDEAVDDIVRAKLTQLAESNPDAARRLLAETERVAGAYGLEVE